MLLVGPAPVNDGYKERPSVERESYVLWYQTNIVIIIDNQFVKINNIMKIKENSNIKYSVEYQDVEYSYTNLSIYSLKERLYRENLKKRLYKVFVTYVTEAKQGHPWIDRDASNGAPIYEPKPNPFFAHPDTNRISRFKVLTGYHYTIDYPNDNITTYRYKNKSTQIRLSKGLYPKSEQYVYHKNGFYYTSFLLFIVKNTDFLQKFVNNQICFVISFDSYVSFNKWTEAINIKDTLNLGYNLISFADESTAYKYYTYFVLDINDSGIICLEYGNPVIRQKTKVFMVITFWRFLLELYYPNVSISELYFNDDKSFILNRIVNLIKIKYIYHGEVIYNYPVVSRGNRELATNKNLCLELEFYYPKEYLFKLSSVNIKCTILIAHESYQKLFYNCLSQDGYFDREERTTEIIISILMSAILDPSTKTFYICDRIAGAYIEKEYFLVM